MGHHMTRMTTKVSRSIPSPRSRKPRQVAEGGFLCLTHVRHGLKSGTTPTMMDRVDRVAQDPFGRFDWRRSPSTRPLHPSLRLPRHLERHREDPRGAEVRRAQHQREAKQADQGQSLRSQHSDASEWLRWHRHQGEGWGMSHRLQKNFFVALHLCQRHHRRR